MTIKTLIESSKETATSINALLTQLSEKATVLSQDDLSRMLAQPNFYLLVAQEEGIIVGMASMYIVELLSGKNAFIEDVVVDEGQRGKGLGKTLMEALIAIAKQQNVRHVDLTSRPERVAANELYKKLGFQQRNTNVYRLYLIAQ